LLTFNKVYSALPSSSSLANNVNPPLIEDVDRLHIEDVKTLQVVFSREWVKIPDR